MKAKKENEQTNENSLIYYLSNSYDMIYLLNISTLGWICLQIRTKYKRMFYLALMVAVVTCAYTLQFD